MSSGEAPAFVNAIGLGGKAVSLYVQVSNGSLEKSARILLMQQIMRGPLSHQLRTERRLVHLIFASVPPSKDVLETIIVVQSGTASIDSIQEAVENFVGRVAELAPVDLGPHKSAAPNRLLNAPANLQDYRQRIIRDDVSYNRRTPVRSCYMDRGWCDWHEAVLELTPLIGRPTDTRFGFPTFK